MGINEKKMAMLCKGNVALVDQLKSSDESIMCRCFRLVLDARCQRRTKKPSSGVACFSSLVDFSSFIRKSSTAHYTLHFLLGVSWSWTIFLVVVVVVVGLPLILDALEQSSSAARSMASIAASIYTWSGGSSLASISEIDVDNVGRVHGPVKLDSRLAI